MPQRFKRLAALLLALMLLCGCAGPSLRENTNRLRSARATEPSEVQSTNVELAYQRPDLEELEALKQTASEAAQTGTVRETVDAVYAFYDAYDWFYTYYYIADIRYSTDLTDTYWEAEYNFCVDSSVLADTLLEELLYDLAASPLRDKLEADQLFGEGFFDSYEGENLWDDTFTALMERENELHNRYYEVSGLALDYPAGSDRLYDACGEDMAQILVELIQVRNEMAAYWGYDTYAEFAWDFYYDRDFTPAQTESYYADIARELVPLYRETADGDAWDIFYRSAREEDTYQYVRTAAENMGGMVWEAFLVMEEGQLYDITYGRNKYASSFEVFLTGYGVPFVFVCPERSPYDYLTFAHEFGHFCNDYASYGSYAGIDIFEVFSQGMEYLSLCYGEENLPLTRGKLADSLATYVEQAAFAAFEQRMYLLEGDDLSVEGLCRLYEEVALEFGFDAVGYDRREFVEINHFYTDPMYIVSYVVSNDAALQLYQLELEQPGAGAELFQEHLDTEQYLFLAFLEETGLESPFAPGRLESVRETFAQGLAS